MSSLLEVSHETHYAYSAAVQHALHLAHLQPLSDDGQSLLGHALHIEPPPAQSGAGRDWLGNQRVHFSILSPHKSLSVRAVSRLRVSDRFAQMRPEASPPWEQVRDRLRYQAGAAYEPAIEFAQASRYVPRLEALRDYALPSFTPGRPLALASLHLMERLHADFEYRPASTDVNTPLAQAFAHRHGVCQDFAHLMCGAIRMLGLAARYVSGYLLTQPAADSPALLGADASHAWVQVWCPDTPGMPSSAWMSLDPTNNMVPAEGHVRLAVGRDYGDVAPLRGVIQGGGSHTLSVAVRTRRLDSDALDTAQSAATRSAA